MPTKLHDRRPPRIAHHHEQAGGKPVGVPERILDAALSILGESGIRNLTQVQVANRARVRQSHLTYYFPTRDDLLDAVTERAVDGIVSGFRQATTTGATKAGQRPLLDRLARSVADLAHMRMFVAMIVEADADPIVRRLMRRGTERIEVALTEVLGGDDARERARLVLAAIWGLGLYQFLMRPATNASPTRAYLSWLVRASTGPEAAGGRGRSDHGVTDMR
jgi:AcrR family transcriptional regulator